MSEEAIKIINDLQEVNDSLRQKLEDLALQNETLACERNEQKQKIDLLQEKVNDLLHRLFGRKSERFENPNQMDFLKLLGWPAGAQSEESKPRDLERIEYTRDRAKKRGPKPIPEHLPREDVAVDPPQEERVCACCAKDMKRVGEVVTEELEVTPPKFLVKRYIQGKWRCPECMNRDRVRPLAPRPIKKGRPSPSLLAYIVISKYLDHLPLNRQEEIFNRYGLRLARQTMDEWLGQLRKLLRPIVEAMKHWLLERSYLQLDETPFHFKDEEQKGKLRRCYIWAYGIPAGEVVYDVSASRSPKAPKEFLNGFSGHLQADGYPGFLDLFRDGKIKHVSCMAHIRRKFRDAKHALPERVEEILELIKDLYKIERVAREADLDGVSRVKFREENASKFFTDLKTKIDELQPIPLPKSKLGKAVSYAMGQWPTMRRYLEVGECEIDNNWCELAIRPLKLGANNFLFLGSLKGGGERAEVFYSLVQTCRRLKMNAFEYLKDVIQKVAENPSAPMWELSPRGWKEAQERAEKLPV